MQIKYYNGSLCMSPATHMPRRHLGSRCPGFYPQCVLVLDSSIDPEPPCRFLYLAFLPFSCFGFCLFCSVSCRRKPVHRLRVWAAAWRPREVPVALPCSVFVAPSRFPCRVSSRLSLQTKLASACRLASFWDPREKGVCLACRLPGTARSARVSRAIGAADPQYFSAHGPSTKLGSFGLPSAFLRRLRNRFGTHLRFFVALLLVSSRLCLHRVFPLQRC
ncbi:hypothetical protein C8R43DRAFT_582685 [Mycena crocata]|nr:hypothetical protein C8R43DRAFT_582685 [Mycena crocata]